MKAYITEEDAHNLAERIEALGLALGFQQVGFTNTDLTRYEKSFNAWLSKNYQGEMHYMHKHGCKRTQPQELVPGTLRIISVRMDYLPLHKKLAELLHHSHKAYVSCYALGRDYHKLMRKRLEHFANAIQALIGREHHYRVFVDSAPVLEKPLAEKAGLGWIGKHTNLINAKAGSWFFLGEIFTDIPLPINQAAVKSHCGSCQACIAICPTKAIVAPYQLDARRCISYLTIELKGSIPKDLRPLMGNRIYGCDDCQLICPWNKFAKTTKEKDFYARNQLKDPDLVSLFAWDENTFLKYTEGSAIRRIGYISWLRNIAVALGNAKTDPVIVDALKQKLFHSDDIVREHVAWALEQH